MPRKKKERGKKKDAVRVIPLDKKGKALGRGGPRSRIRRVPRPSASKCYSQPKEIRKHKWSASSPFWRERIRPGEKPEAKAQLAKKAKDRTRNPRSALCANLGKKGITQREKKPGSGRRKETRGKFCLKFFLDEKIF